MDVGHFHVNRPDHHAVFQTNGNGAINHFGQRPGVLFADFQFHGQTIFDFGKNFLNEGAVLTLRVIQTLQLWGFRYVDIREEVAGEAMDEAGAPGTGLNAETEPSGESIKEKSKVPAGFQAYYQAAVQIFKMNLGRARFVKDGFEVADIRQMVSECVLPLIEDAAVMDNLQMVSHTEDYLYHHSVDVGILSGCIGMWMGRPFREIEEIILGALLHDAGKTLIPLKVLNKPAVLTEEETQSGAVPFDQGL